MWLVLGLLNGLGRKKEKDGSLIILGLAGFLELKLLFGLL